MTTQTPNTLTIDGRTYTLHAASGFYVRAWTVNTHATVWAGQAADALTLMVSTVCLRRDTDSAIAQAVTELERKIANGGALVPDEEDTSDEGYDDTEDDTNEDDYTALYGSDYSDHEQYQRDWNQSDFIDDHSRFGGIRI